MSEEDKKTNKKFIVGGVIILMVLLTNLIMSLYLSFSIKPVDQKSITEITEAVNRVESYAKDLAELAILNRSIVINDQRLEHLNETALNKKYEDICAKYKVDCGPIDDSINGMQPRQNK